MSYNPLVSVIMPVYNGEAYLRESILSILHQTYKNIEFIIINDGSVDSSAVILSEFVEMDERILIHNNNKNQGVTTCLNQGLSLANGELIARMDADDISLPKRLEKQILYLKENPDCSLVGCQTEFIFNKRKPSGIYSQYPTDHETLKISSLFYSPFSHPTVMFRKEICSEFNYDSNYYKIEDYDLWTRIINDNIVANLNERLLYYRMHASQETQTENSIRLANLKKLYRRQFENHHISFSENDLETHLLIPGSNVIQLNLEQIEIIEKWLLNLFNQIQKKDTFNSDQLNKVFSVVWNNVCLKGKHNGINAYSKLKSSTFYNNKISNSIFYYFLSHHFFSQLHKIYFKIKRS